MQKGIWLTILSLAVIVIMALSCTQSASPGSTPPAGSSQAAAPAEVLKVGAPNAYTGTGASSGIPTLKAYQIQAQILKDNGGFKVGGKTYNIELIDADDQYTTAGGVAAANKLIFADKVKFFLGPLSSAAMMGMVPLVQENKIVTMTNSTTYEKFKDGCRYIFQPNYPGGLVGASELFSLIEGNTAIKNVAAISPNDETGRTNWAQMKTGLDDIRKKYGQDRVKVVFEDYAERAQNDYTPIISKMLAAKPDLIVINAFVGEAPLIVKQSRELGYKGPYVNAMAPDPKEMASVAGEKNVYEYYSWGVIWSDLPKVTVDSKYTDLYKKLTAKFGAEPLAEFYKRYKTSFNEDPPGATVYMFDNMPLLVMALEEANSFDPEKVVQVMESWQAWPSYYGIGVWSGATNSYGIKHVATKPFPALKQEGSKLISAGFVNPAPIP